MKLEWVRFAVFSLSISIAGAASAGLNTFVKLEGVTGESSPPGAPGAIAVDPLGISSGAFEATKPLDATSPALSQAATLGTPISSVSLLFYDDLASDSEPDAALVLHGALITQIRPVTLGSVSGEAVSVVFASPSISMFLEIPGLTGEESAPGHPGVIGIESLSLSGDGFSILKAIDAASPHLSTAAVTGTPFSTASILFYSNIGGETQPDFSIVYQNALVSSFSQSSVMERPEETVSFVASTVTVTHPVPEPEAGQELLAALFGAALLYHRIERRNGAILRSAWPR